MCSAQRHARHARHEFYKYGNLIGHSRFLRMKRHEDQENFSDPLSCLRKMEWSGDETNSQTTPVA